MFGTQTWLGNESGYRTRLNTHMTRLSSLYDQFSLHNNSEQLNEFLYDQMTDRIALIHKMNPKLSDMIDVAETLYPEKGMRRKFVQLIIFGA